MHASQDNLDYQRYYQDEDYFNDRYCEYGLDTDDSWGLESGNLVFVAAHGDRDHWLDRDGHEISLNQTSIGDLYPRYLWMASCNIMAHGPENPITGEAPHYFDPLEDHHDNVFRRWGFRYENLSPLHKKLRFACGGSTFIGGGDDGLAVTGIWHNYRIRRLPPSDSFILGLAINWRIPLCIARGGQKLEDSPLFRDRDFTAEANSWGKKGYVHAQYPVLCQLKRKEVIPLLKSLFPGPEGKPRIEDLLVFPGGSEAPVDTGDQGIQSETTEEIPVVILEPLGLPESLPQPAKSAGFGFSEADLSWSELPEWLPGSPGIGEGEEALFSFRHNSDSGAVLVSWEDCRHQQSPESGDLLGVLLLLELLEEPHQGWRQELEWKRPGEQKTTVSAEPATDQFSLRQMRFDRVPSEDLDDIECDRFKCSRTCLNLEFPIRIRVGPKPFPIFGEGGRILLRYCPGWSSHLDLTASCGDTRVCGGDEEPCPFEGCHAFDFSIGRWKLLATESIDPDNFLNRSEAEVAVARRLRVSGQDRTYDLTNAEVTLGYRIAPLHCRHPSDLENLDGPQQLTPVYRFQIPRADGPGTGLTIEIPADGSLPTVDREWVCSGPDD